MANGDFKNLPRRTAFDKLLRDKAFNIAKDLKQDEYQINLIQRLINVLIKKTSSGVVRSKTSVTQVKSANMTSQQLVEELHRPIIRKFEKRKVYSSFIYNICSTDVVDMESISKFNKGFLFLLCIIDIYNKYALVVPLKNN